MPKKLRPSFLTTFAGNLARDVDARANNFSRATHCHRMPSCSSEVLDLILGNPHAAMKGSHPLIPKPLSRVAAFDFFHVKQFRMQMCGLAGFISFGEPGSTITTGKTLESVAWSPLTRYFWTEVLHSPRVNMRIAGPRARRNYR